MPKSTEKIKLLRGTRANIKAVVDNNKLADFDLEQGELALDVTDGYLIAGTNGTKTNNKVNDSKHIIATNKLIGYDSDENGITTAAGSGKYSVQYNGTDKSLDILNENGNIDVIAHSDVNVTAQNGNINETASGDVDIDASQNITIDANGGNIVLTSKHSYLSAENLNYNEDETYYEKSGDTYVEANPPVANATNFNNRKANLYIANIGEDGDGKIVLNGQTNLSEDGKTLKVGSASIGEETISNTNNTCSYVDIQRVRNGLDNYVSITRQNDVLDIQGFHAIDEQYQTNKKITTLNKITDTTTPDNNVKGIEFETDLKEEIASDEDDPETNPNYKKSTIRTDNLETDTIKSRSETDLDIQSKGTDKKIKLNTNTTIDEDGQTLKVDNGESEAENHNTQVTPVNIITDELDADTITNRTSEGEVSIINVNLSEASKIDGKSGADIGSWEIYTYSDDIHQWSNTVNYSITDLVFVFGPTYYKSKVDNNKNNQVTDSDYWLEIEAYNPSTPYSNGTFAMKDGNCYKYVTSTSTSKTVKFNESETCANVNIKDSVVQATGFTGGLDIGTNTTPQIPSGQFKLLRQALLDMIYPVGSIYMSVNTVSPASFLGGTWESWGEGCVPVGVNTDDTDFATPEQTGGEKTHILTTDEMPSHNHGHHVSVREMSGVIGVTTQQGAPQAVAAAASELGSKVVVIQPYFNGGTYSELEINTAGNGVAHNNLQPYITCYMWKRTA